jgi:hypothetical protein
MGVDNNVQKWYARTYWFSVVVQFASLIFAVVAILVVHAGQFHGKRSFFRHLGSVLLGETFVNVVQLLQYGRYLRIDCIDCCCCCAQGYKNPNQTVVLPSISIRYYEWFVTTPVMLFTLVLFDEWEDDPSCFDSLGWTSRSTGGWVLAAVLADWLMLGAGYATELLWNGAIVRRDEFVVVVVVVSWLAFAALFASIFVATDVSASSSWSQLAYWATVFTWAMYGVVACLSWFWKVSNDLRGVLYNLIDVLSKNVVGIVISCVAVSSESEHALAPNATCG